MNRFDTDAYTFDEKPMHIERARCVASEILRTIDIKDDWYLADFGCGTGLLGFSLMKNFKYIDMIDSSSGMLSVVKDKIQKMKLNNVKTVQMDIFKDKIPVSKYNVIATLMTLHHIPDLETLIEKFAQMLVEGGYLCIADLDEEDGSYHPTEQTPHNGINQEYLQDIAKRNNFTLVRKCIPYVIKKEVNGKLREYPVFLHVYNTSAKC